MQEKSQLSELVSTELPELYGELFAHPSSSSLPHTSRSMELTLTWVYRLSPQVHPYR